MGTQEFLVGLLSAGGGGAALWLVMGMIVKAAPQLDKSKTAKFWLAFVLAFIIPTGAYLLLITAFSQLFTWEGLLLAVGAGYQISQGVHRATETIVEGKDIS